MTDKEKLDAIRAEIHRLIDVRGYDRGMANDLFAFMDSLPEEPVSEDLEKAADKYVLDEKCKPWAELCKKAFKSGANWQKIQDSQLPKIQQRDTIDEYAYQVAYDLSNDWMRDNPTWDDVQKACKLGAEWKRDQMMENAVEETVFVDRWRDQEVVSHYFDWDEGFKAGQKVKLIIIKQEEK